MKKRLIIAVGAVLLVLSLSLCSGGSQQQQQKPSSHVSSHYELSKHTYEPALFTMVRQP
jgi:hypothetical protein